MYAIFFLFNLYINDINNGGFSFTKANHRLEVRTLGFHPKNEGSIPSDLNLLKLRFVTPNYTLIQKSFFNFFCKFLFSIFIFLHFLDLYLWVSSFKKLNFKFNKFVIFKKITNKVSIVKSPLGFRQWSQEQYAKRQIFIQFNFKLTSLSPALGSQSQVNYYIDLDNKFTLNLNLWFFFCCSLFFSYSAVYLKSLVLVTHHSIFVKL